MSQNKRIMIAVVVVLVIVAGVIAVDLWQRQAIAEEIELPAGSVPIYYSGELVGGVVPQDLEGLEAVSFKDAEEGKTQEGWLLADVLLQHLDENDLITGSKITVSSSSREKTAVLTWDEVQNRNNMIMFDISNRGTLKLVSLLERLDTRDEWVQDADKIEIEP